MRKALRRVVALEMYADWSKLRQFVLTQYSADNDENEAAQPLYDRHDHVDLWLALTRDLLESDLAQFIFECSFCHGVFISNL